MNVNNLTELIAQTEEQLLNLNDLVIQLKSEISQLTEENNQLRMTNHDLHDLLLEQTQEKETPLQEVQPEETMQAKSRLQDYYDEGIHVCHQLFGARRDDDEECIFCLGVLDKIKAD